MGCDKRFGEEYQDWTRVEDVDWEAPKGSLWGVASIYVLIGGWLYKYIHMYKYIYIYCICICTHTFV